MESLLCHIDKLIVTKCQAGSCGFNHDVSVDNVKTSVKLLKKHKHDGDLGHYSDHLIFGTDTLNVYLSLLITSMISHGYAYQQLLLSTIIPIVKNKRKSVNNSNNYRGIALSGVIGKLIDVIIIDAQADALKSSYLQFGIKGRWMTL